jgi:pteridine reductase
MAESGEKRVALVTGGAKRVGRAIVEKLADEGFDVAFTYLSSEPEAASLEHALRSRVGRAMAIRADLTRPESEVPAIADAFRQEFTRLDVLVNSASLYAPADLAQTTLDLSRKLMAIHLESPLLLAQSFAPMLRQSRGHVVNMVDLLAERPWPQYLAYCASKAALMNLTLGLARELAPEVTVNGIAPGVVEWPADYPESERQKYLKRVPLGRAGTPQDVANLVHFLATGGGYITGQVIRLDGGRSIT